MSNAPKTAADDLIDIYWRHHAKWDMPSSLRGKHGVGEDFGQLANDACSIIKSLLAEVPLVCRSEELSQRAIIESRRAAQKRVQSWAGRKGLLSRLESVMAEVDGSEWHYSWGLHQILDILPQTLEEK